ILLTGEDSHVAPNPFPPARNRRQAHMILATTLAELRQARAALPGTFGLVPTRGALHAGKLSLVARARAECNHVGVSLVPAPGRAPPELAADLSALEPLGVDLAWAPSPGAVFPPDHQTWVSVEHVGAPLEGKHQAWHFRDFATLIARLFHLFAPSHAYFGQID